MIRPESKRYRFLSRISNNDLSQSWAASDLKSSEPCFVKLLAADSTLDRRMCESILSESFRFQSVLRHRAIIRAHKKHIEDGVLYLEYPYLDRAVWQELTPELFQQHFSSILRQICLVIDYVHLLDLVHCDLKLSNFLIDSSDDEPVVLLVDLDFLCPADSPPLGRILGTPNHIAPEIISNDRITIQSDNYSLGMSFKEAVAHLSKRTISGSTLSAEEHKSMEQLIEELTQPDYIHRPRSLAKALYESGIIDGDLFDREQKRLLSMVLLSRFSGSDKGKLGEFKGLKQFITEKNKILGLHDDLIEELAAACARSRLVGFQSFKSLLNKASVERLADYWHLTLGDDDLQEIYSELEHHNRPGMDISSTGAADTVNDPFRILHKCRVLRVEGRFERSYIKLLELMKRISDCDSERFQSALIPVLSELGTAARALNKLTDAERYLSELLTLHEQESCSTAPLYRELVSLNLTLGRLDRVAELLSRGKHEVDWATVGRHTLELRQLEAWFLMKKGNSQKSLEILSKLFGEATRLGLWELAVTIKYSLSVVHLQKGETIQAKNSLEESYELARSRSIVSRSVPVLATLAWVYCELAQYDKAAGMGKLAARTVAGPRDTMSMPLICNSIVYAFTRLAEYTKAGFWIQKQLGIGALQNSRQTLATSYVSDGFLALNSGDLLHSMESLHKSLELVDANVSPAIAAKAWQNLAEVALHGGNYTKCAAALEKARKLFDKVENLGSVTELDLIACLNDLYYGDGDQLVRLSRLSEKLLQHNCSYFGVLAVFHYLLSADSADGLRILETARTVTNSGEKSRPPLFVAVSRLLQRTRSGDPDLASEVTTWKTAFKELVDARSNFLAMLVGIKVANLYQKASRRRHAQKFLRQSLHLAQGLSNGPMVHSIEKKLQSASQAASDHSQLIDSFLGVSSILKNIEDYSESLTQFVHFAVDQTGAERGVLLLKSKDHRKLRIGEAVNCDEASLSDIVDISRTVALDSSRRASPIIVDNALDDKRTRRYRSIVRHNILSVVCVPLTDGDDVLGVLYLDHHTIPALFEKDDIVYIQSMANFLAIVLRTLRDYRSLHSTNKQLIEDLNQLGAKHSFITRDPAIMQLLDKLPQISTTNAPVLLLGESGTGKEILCHMIHNQSPRSKKPLVKLNCAAMASSMIESELFGVAKNVATGVAEREGRFSAAEEGTLFIDEIGDMPLEVQAKVLRVLEYQEFEKVGSNRSVYTDVRFLYATNRDLAKLMKKGEFREDLYYRISTVLIEIPPLRDRIDDIPLLLEHFTKVFSDGKTPPRFTLDALEALVAYRWPGNVRQLRNFVEHCCIMHPGTRFDASMLPPEILDPDAKLHRGRQLTSALEATRIKSALCDSSWNQSHASRRLGMPLSTLRRKIKKLNIRKYP